MTALKTLLLAGLVLATLSLQACNTMEGAGEDVSSAGHAVSRAAQ